MKSDFLIKTKRDLLTRIVVMLLLSGVIMMVCYSSVPALWELYIGVAFAGGIVVILGYLYEDYRRRPLRLCDRQKLKVAFELGSRRKTAIRATMFDSQGGYREVLLIGQGKIQDEIDRRNRIPPKG